MAKKPEAAKSNRVTDADLFRAVKPIKPGRTNGMIDHKVVIYTMKGMSNTKDKDGNFTVATEEDVNAFAKKSIANLAERYYIKSDGKNLLNPIGMYSISDRSRQKVPGLVRWTFRAVNKNTFESYLRFLRTKNDIHLSHAERENV